MNIPERAVQIVERHIRFYTDNLDADYEVEARATLESVAHLLMATAWDEGFEAACDSNLRENPYRKAEDTFADRMAKRSLDAINDPSWRNKQ